VLALQGRLLLHEGASETRLETSSGILRDSSRARRIRRACGTAAAATATATATAPAPAPAPAPASAPAPPAAAAAAAAAAATATAAAAAATTAAVHDRKQQYRSAESARNRQPQTIERARRF